MTALILGAHELSHILVAKSNEVKLGVPYFVPSWQVKCVCYCLVLIFIYSVPWRHFFRELAKRLLSIQSNPLLLTDLYCVGGR